MFIFINKDKVRPRTAFIYRFDSGDTRLKDLNAFSIRNNIENGDGF